MVTGQPICDGLVNTQRREQIFGEVKLPVLAAHYMRDASFFLHFERFVVDIVQTCIIVVSSLQPDL